MANEYYISAGLPPNDTDQSNTANSNYISAGLIDEDVATAGGSSNSIIIITSKLLKYVPVLLVGSVAVTIVKKNPKLTRRELFNPLRWFK